MSWYKISQTSQLVNILSTLLRDVAFGAVAIEDDRIGQVATLLPTVEALGAAVAGALEMLRQPELTPEQLEVLESIRAAFFSMGKMKGLQDDEQQQQQLQMEPSQTDIEQVPDGIPPEAPIPG